MVGFPRFDCFVFTDGNVAVVIGSGLALHRPLSSQEVIPLNNLRVTHASIDAGDGKCRGTQLPEKTFLILGNNTFGSPASKPQPPSQDPSRYCSAREVLQQTSMLEISWMQLSSTVGVVKAVCSRFF